MIAFSSTIETELLTKRGISQISRQANRLEMVSHKVNRLPLHFQNVPESRPGGAWGYKARSRKYQIRKARKHGHQKPLVFSGELEQAVLRSAKVTATATRGRISARGSRKSNLTTQFRDEIEAISSREEQRAAENWGTTFTTLASDSRYQKKRKR
jgi:hypothetical protein